MEKVEEQRGKMVVTSVAMMEVVGLALKGPR
jgi:hypothetical protein